MLRGFHKTTKNKWQNKSPIEIEGDESSIYRSWTALKKKQGTSFSDMVVWVINIIEEIKGRRVEEVVI